MPSNNIFVDFYIVWTIKNLKSKRPTHVTIFSRKSWYDNNKFRLGNRCSYIVFAYIVIFLKSGDSDPLSVKYNIG